MSYTSLNQSEAIEYTAEFFRSFESDGKSSLSEQEKTIVRLFVKWLYEEGWEIGGF